MSSSQQSQVDLTNRMYDDRAKDYENSWHPAYSKRFIKVVNAKRGDRVLDLACGSGLDAVLAAAQVGDKGSVVCVDASEKMLDEFKAKLEQDPTLSYVVQIIRHDVTNLQTCREIRDQEFDLILCSNAFVLFGNPAEVIQQWRGYLKPGGRMIIDIPHEQSHRQGIMMETVAERLGLPFPCCRRWITSRESFKDFLESHGLVVEKTETLRDAAGKGLTYIDVSQADEQFNNVKSIPLFERVITDELKKQAKELFREEWERAAVDG